MKIILKKDVANLGEAGEIVEVKTGYALNYLVPQGFAIIGTPSAIRQHEETIASAHTRKPRTSPRPRPTLRRSLLPSSRSL